LRVRVGGLFETGMYDIDNTLILMPLKDVEETLGISPMGIDVKINDGYKADHIRQEILKMVGRGFFARTWIEMNRNLFSALKLEKIAMFIILCLIIFVASFNIISSLIMTVMEKRKDIAILKAMGAKSRSIMKIFMVEGVTIGISGALIGSILGYGICELIERYKIIKLPTDIYYINTLPVKISPFDVIIIAA
jgi:lipoprotein-releasing system permease protein